ncbi:MAG: transcriptional regulator [Betaproteobacteria bacterium]|nr:transcriptional regulator [Betaproteobacteria bacterium]
MDENVLTIGVASLAEVMARMKAQLRSGQRDATPRFTFTSSEDLLRTLNPNRWNLLQAMTGAGSLGVRELARRVNRDVKGVHTDTVALLACGLIDKTDNGALLFPYAGVRVEFEAPAKVA